MHADGSFLDGNEACCFASRAESPRIPRWRRRQLQNIVLQVVTVNIGLAQALLQMRGGKAMNFFLAIYYKAVTRNITCHKDVIFWFYSVGVHCG